MVVVVPRVRVPDCRGEEVANQIKKLVVVGGPSDGRRRGGGAARALDGARGAWV
jgi:hypothetical protein